MIFNLVDRPDSTLVGFGDDDDHDDHAENDGLDDGPDCTLVVFGDDDDHAENDCPNSKQYSGCV